MDGQLAGFALATRVDDLLSVGPWVVRPEVERPADLLERPEAYLSRAAARVPVVADRAGFLCAIDTKSVGEAVVDLGGGRRRGGHVIDPAVGIDGIRSAGEAVEPGEPLAFVHAANSEDAAQVAGRLVSCFGIAEEQPEIQGVVHGRVTGAKRK